MTKGLCIITGASSGLGRTYAKKFAQDGYNLLVIARRKERLEELKSQLSAVQVEVQQVDLVDEHSLDSLCKKIRNLPQISVLINNAGFGRTELLENSDPRVLNNMCQLNMIAPMKLSLAAYEVMRGQKRGKIINVSSVMAFQPSPTMACYGATKAFLSSFSTAFAVEAKEHGVQVFTQCPGPVSTEFHLSAGLSEKIPALQAATTEDVTEHLVQSLKGSSKIIVPGFKNKALILLSKILPNKVSTAIMFKILRRYAK